MVFFTKFFSDYSLVSLSKSIILKDFMPVYASLGGIAGQVDLCSLRSVYLPSVEYRLLISTRSKVIGILSFPFNLLLFLATLVAC